MNPLSMITSGFITPVIAIATQQVAQVPLSPSQAQSLLVKSLELPLPTSLTNGYGIFQSDVIIRTALIAAIADLRANPWLLKYCFASLPKDKLTLADYGEQEVQRAIDWFTSTDIPVIIQPRVDSAKLPCISIQLVESSENASTVGDIHYEPNQDTDTGNWPVYFGPFRPYSYTPLSGLVVIDPAQAAGFTFQEDQLLVDSTGKSYPIVEVVDDSSFYIAPGVVADFTAATIRPSKPAYVARLESIEFKETYNLGCHVLSEPVHLTYLHSIVVFCLLRYKQALMDPRGLERTTISSADPQHNGNYGKDNVFSRFVMLTGFVRHYWPSGVDPKIGSITVDITECAPSTPITTREQLAVPLVSCDLATKPVQPPLFSVVGGFATSFGTSSAVFCSDGTLLNPAALDPLAAPPIPAGVWVVRLDGETVFSGPLIGQSGIAVYDPTGTALGATASDGVNPGKWIIYCPNGTFMLGGSCGIAG